MHRSVRWKAGNQPAKSTVPVHHGGKHDATLRDGEQTPGVVFSVADKVAIAEKLSEIGVDRIEAGMPAVSDQDFQAIKEIARLNLPSKIFTFARAMRADIDKSLECGAHGVIVEVPIGYPKLQWQFKWTWEDVLRKSVDVVNYARSRGLYVVYFPYDTTRAREEDLTNLLTRMMQDAPPDSITALILLAASRSTPSFSLPWIISKPGSMEPITEALMELKSFCSFTSLS